MTASIRPGDVVVYRKQKFSAKPGPNARQIDPSPRGDSYSYLVSKFWRVVSVPSEQVIVVCTRTGKELKVNANDPNLRRAGLWDWLWFRKRFPQPPEGGPAQLPQM